MVQALVEKLEQIGPTEKEKVASVPQSEQLAKDARAALAKRKKSRAISLDHQIVRRERFKVSESRTVGEKEEGQKAPP